MYTIFEVIGTFLQIAGRVVFEFYGWVLIVAYFGYNIWQNRRRIVWVQKTDNVLLIIEVPNDNDKKELSAEHMFASLHGILRPKSELAKEGSLQEHISFEIASIGNQIRFFVWTPKHLKDFVESQIYAQYPSVQIREGIEDYAEHDTAGRHIYGAEIELTKKEVLPIKTFTTFEVDPLAGITAVLAKLEEEGEEMWIQILARPIDDSWQDKGAAFVESIRGSGSGDLRSVLRKELYSLPKYIFSNFLRALLSPPSSSDVAKKEISTAQSSVIKAVEEKITKLGYQVKVRVAYIGPSQNLARQRIQAIVGGFKQFNSTNLNGFTVNNYHNDRDYLKAYRARLFTDDGYILNIEELASLYHLPHTNVATPSIVWTTSKTAEPPSNLPAAGKTPAEDVSLFGKVNFRGNSIKFGIKRKDRNRHLYVIGQTGQGKSQLLELLTLSDIHQNCGFAIIDPHGDYATDILKHIPANRLDDVVYFNPSDREFPMAFNPLELIDIDSKNHVTSELVGVLKKMFESWGPRLEHILRFTIMALLDTPDTTILGVTRMLTDKEYRKLIVKNIQDPIVKAFWVNEFASWNDKFANEAVAPVLNKVGAFVANPLIRNIVGQPKSTFNIREIMDSGKILIVNLSRGLVGEDNAAILGALMVTKIQLAAMSRANMSLEDRLPFYLYVDEFQNFATDSFAVILSEARKYGLYLTVANQYISQMQDTVKDAVFGNVGSMICFKVGADDAQYLGKYFEPVFESSDLIKLHTRDIFVAMSIDGERALPFSARTLTLPPPPDDQMDTIIDKSRKRYGAPRIDIEQKIVEWTGLANDIEERKPNMLKELKNNSPIAKSVAPGAPSAHIHKSPQIRQNAEVAQSKQPEQKVEQVQPNQTIKLR